MEAWNLEVEVEEALVAQSGPGSDVTVPRSKVLIDLLLPSGGRFTRIVKDIEMVFERETYVCMENDTVGTRYQFAGYEYKANQYIY